MRLSQNYHKLFFLSCLFLSACAENSYKYEFLVFGTLVELEIYGTSQVKADNANRQIQNTFRQMHTTWHAWEQGGLLSKINKAIANRTSITLQPEVMRFLRKVQDLSQKSMNNFNPGIGKLVALWGFHREDWQGPPPAAVELGKYIKPVINMQSLTFKNNVLSSQDDRIQIDLGAVAKGHALDLAINILKQQGIKNAVVNAGGDLKVLGKKNSRDWNIGVNSAQGVIASIKLNDGESIVSSGTYERKFTYEDKIYHHLISPFTGKPAQGISAVTVLSQDAMLADAAATAILVAGKDNWQAIANKMGVEYILVILDDNVLQMSPQMQKRVMLK